MYRTLVILGHTFREVIVQPIYTLTVSVGVMILTVFAFLPFFTLGEDTVMFKSVGLDVITLLVLIATLFATSKSIFDEIEDRTMLTLMSKPVKKWEVMLGKYLGIILASLLAVAITGAVLTLATWWRIPTDYLIRGATLDDREAKRLLDIRMMHVAGLVPSLLLAWLQISVLAAVGVALSTRFSLVVNLPVVIILYIAGNLTRFLFPLSDGAGGWAADLLATVLPFLSVFDLKDQTVYALIKLDGTQYASDPRAIPLTVIWRCLGVAALYAVAYATFTLSAGMLLFQNRELGGGEG